MHLMRSITEEHPSNKMLTLPERSRAYYTVLYCCANAMTRCHNEMRKGHLGNARVTSGNAGSGPVSVTPCFQSKWYRTERTRGY